MDTNTADFLVRVAIRRAIEDSPDADPADRIHHGAVSRIRRAALARAEAAEVEASAVREARAAGASWVEIGDALGVTKQAAQMRFGK